MERSLTVSEAPALPSGFGTGDPSVVDAQQRRIHLRVPSTAESTPMVRLRHPMIPDMRLHLAVLDLSLGGCALALPDNLPSIDPGVLINEVHLELDVEHAIRVSMQLLHITSIDFDSDALRLGCAFGDMPHDDRDRLQAYLDRAGASLPATA